MAKQGPLSGQIVGEKYLLGELLGEGGFGAVYKAQHLQIGRQQAVKILLEQHFQKSDFRERFVREARTVAALDHPCIIHLDDFWLDSSRAYLVMPFLSGGTLQDILRKQQGFLQLEEVTSYLENICAALDYAHQQDIVHLDLKPLNLLVHEDGRLLLTDFGLAHLVTQGMVAGGTSLLFGTPHYMAPEHIQGHPEKQSDVYALGVILYQMLVARRPFEGELEVLAQHLTELPPPLRKWRPELPQELEEVLAKALAKEVVQRYQSAGELLEAFKEGLVSPSSGTKTQPAIPAQDTVKLPPARTSPYARHRGKIINVIAALILLFSGIAIVLTHLPTPTRNQSQWHIQFFNISRNFFLTGVAWSGTQFVAVGGGGTILTSPDGRTWTSQNLPTSVDSTYMDVTSVAWSGTQFVAVGPYTILTSPDGRTWTSQNDPTYEVLSGVVWSGTQFVAVGGGGTILTSPDGRTWHTQFSPTSLDLSGVAWSGTRFVAVGGGGTILTSPDGRTWTSQNLPTSLDPSWVDLTRGMTRILSWDSHLDSKSLKCS